MPLLDVNGLTVAYEGRGERVVAVDDASFSMESGEILAVVGESGSGKSSLALAITRLLPSPPATISARAIRFQDADLLHAPQELLRAIRGGKIAYVFQDPGTSLNPVLTIGEQLREMVELHTDRRGQDADDLAVDWLSRVGIPSAQARLRAYPHEFSGGMQQRGMLAMAMASQPALLVADEPTTALDVTIQLQILRLIRDLQRRSGVSLLLISHDLTVVERLAHRVAIMERGKIVEHGPVHQVLREPAHPYTKALLACRVESLRPPPREMAE